MKTLINKSFFIFCSVFLLISTFSIGQNRYSTVQEGYHYQPVNTDLLLQIGQIKDQQIQAEIDAQHQQVMNQIQGLKNWYYSQTTHATPIDNSWNTVNATDNYEFCGIRKVFVSNGVVTKYIGRDGYSELPILKTGTVSLGKAVIQLFDSGDFIEIYF